MTDHEAMGLALAQARLAQQDGEVPVGAVVVRDGIVVGVGRNAPVAAHDPTAHAEILAMRAAATSLGNYRLDGCSLFVTLEPCAMCSGAMLHARLSRVVFAAADPKTGAAGSVLDLFGLAPLNHQTEVRGGVRAEEGAALLRSFFQQRRTEGRALHPLRDDALRTSEARFDGLPGYPWRGHHLNDLPALAGLRLHYLDEGDTGAPGQRSFLCLHGAGLWSYQFRGLVSACTQAGHRVVAPDLPGFGKSDKPKKPEAHSFAWHRQVVHELVTRLALRDTVLVLQGSGVGLGLQWARDHAERVRGIVLVDGGVADAIVMQPPDGDTDPTAAAAREIDVARWLRDASPVPGDASLAQAAPFPDNGHRAAQRAFASMVPPPPVLPAWPALRLTVHPLSDDGGASIAAALLNALA